MMCVVTLRWSNIAIDNGPFEDVFPIKNGDIPASYVSLPEGSITGRGGGQSKTYMAGRHQIFPDL